MTRLLALLLLVGAGGLGVLAWRTVQAPAIVDAGPVAARPRPPGRALTGGFDEARQQTEVATALARPVFSPGRRPRGGPAVAAPTVAAAAALPRMTAILINGATRSAIFDGGDKPTVLKEGQRIGAFTIQSIEPQHVIIVGPEGKRVVRTSFATNPPPPVLQQAGFLPPGLPTGLPQPFPGLNLPGLPPPPDAGRLR